MPDVLFLARQYSIQGSLLALLPTYGTIEHQVHAFQRSIDFLGCMKREMAMMLVHARVLESMQTNRVAEGINSSLMDCVRAAIKHYSRALKAARPDINRNRGLLGEVDLLEDRLATFYAESLEDAEVLPHNIDFGPHAMPLPSEPVAMPTSLEVTQRIQQLKVMRWIVREQIKKRDEMMHLIGRLRKQLREASSVIMEPGDVRPPEAGTPEVKRDGMVPKAQTQP